VIAKRRQLYWPGCVESRPGALSVNDTTPNPNIPNTLFVPAFAPDEPGQSSSASQDVLQGLRRDIELWRIVENVYYNNYGRLPAKHQVAAAGEALNLLARRPAKPRQQVPQKAG
jgi:hypothetical protein